MTGVGTRQWAHMLRFLGEGAGPGSPLYSLTLVGHCSFGGASALLLARAHAPLGQLLFNVLSVLGSSAFRNQKLLVGSSACDALLAHASALAPVSSQVVVTIPQLSLADTVVWHVKLADFQLVFKFTLLPFAMPKPHREVGGHPFTTSSHYFITAHPASNARLKT